MALKRGLDQTTAWMLAFVSTGALFGVGYGISRVLAKRDAARVESELAAEAQERGGEGAAPGVEAAPPHENGEAGPGVRGEHEKSEPAPGERGEHEKSEPKRGKGEHEKSEPKRGEDERGESDRPSTGGAMPTHGTAADVHWSYGGSDGPESWASLSDDYAPCGKGRKQSPVDIAQPQLTSHLLPLRFEYKDAELTLRTNGQLVSADVARGSYVDYDGRSYQLQRLDFHEPSEHKVEGAPYDLEVQLVHQDPEGRVLIISLFYERQGMGGTNKRLAAIWSKLPRLGDPPSDPFVVNVASLLPPKHFYYTYEGSLTTPPCTEGVRWVLLQESQPFSAGQEDAFLASLDRSNGLAVRPLQPLNGRKVLRFSR